MILECDGKVVSDRATTADIGQALAGAPRKEGWYLNLSATPGAYVEAKRAAAGSFTLEYEDRGGLYRAGGAVDEADLRPLLESYLQGDGRWRRHCVWTLERKGPSPSPAPAQMPAASPGFFAGADGRPLPAPVVIIGVGLVVSLTLLPLIPEAWLPLFLLPGFMREKAALPVALVFLAMPALLIGLLIWKLLEARRAGKWPNVPGRIVKSTVEARHVRHADEASTVENMPDIAYEFTVAGKPYTGTRVNLDEIQDPSQLEATLARYPVGATVIVHYDPKDPGTCVLERDLPKGLGKGCLALLACVALVGAAIYVAYENFGRLEAALPAKANAKLMLFAGLFGLVALRMFFMVRKASAAASSWPKATGRVVTSTVESYERRTGRTSSTFYEPAVEYAYEVHGREFRSRQITLGLKTGGSRAFAEKEAARYPAGTKVELRYDPSTPSQAALKFGGSQSWIILVIALLAFAGAIYASGVFG